MAVPGIMFHNTNSFPHSGKNGPTHEKSAKSAHPPTALKAQPSNSAKGAKKSAGGATKQRQRRNLTAPAAQKHSNLKTQNSNLPKPRVFPEGFGDIDPIGCLVVFEQCCHNARKRQC